MSRSFAPVLTGQRAQDRVGGFRGGSGSDGHRSHRGPSLEDMRGAEKELKQTSKRAQGCGERVALMCAVK